MHCALPGWLPSLALLCLCRHQGRPHAGTLASTPHRRLHALQANNPSRPAALLQTLIPRLFSLAEQETQWLAAEGYQGPGSSAAQADPQAAAAQHLCAAIHSATPAPDSAAPVAYSAAPAPVAVDALGNVLDGSMAVVGDEDGVEAASVQQQQQQPVAAGAEGEQQISSPWAQVR